MKPPVLFEQEVLVSDGPTMVAPGTLDRTELRQVNAFELAWAAICWASYRCARRRPHIFNGEGGFKTPQEYTWSPAAEEEMNERLNRLLEG